MTKPARLAFPVKLVDRFCHDTSEILVWRHNSNFRVNWALLDTSMNFGTLIVVTNISIFRYSVKRELRRFPWKPQLIKIHENSMKFIFLRLSRRSIISVSHTNLFTICVLFISRHSTWTVRCHGNCKQRK